MRGDRNLFGFYDKVFDTMGEWWIRGRGVIGSDGRGVDLFGKNGCENGCEVEILSRCIGETA